MFLLADSPTPTFLPTALLVHGPHRWTTMDGHFQKVKSFFWILPSMLQPQFMLISSIQRTNLDQRKILGWHERLWRFTTQEPGCLPLGESEETEMLWNFQLCYCVSFCVFQKLKVRMPPFKKFEFLKEKSLFLVTKILQGTWRNARQTCKECPTPPAHLLLTQKFGSVTLQSFMQNQSEREKQKPGLRTDPEHRGNSPALLQEEEWIFTSRAFKLSSDFGLSFQSWLFELCPH